MRLPRPSHATVVAYLALFVAMSGTAAAATGSLFVLGKANRSTEASALINRTGTPLVLRAKPGKPPLRVNTEQRVGHLNADLLDGRDSSDFLSAAGKASDAHLLDGRDSSHFLSALCTHGSYISASEAIPGGCTEFTTAVAPMQTDFNLFGVVAPGILVQCPGGRLPISGGFNLADDTVRVQYSRPFKARYTHLGWYVALFPGASKESIEASSAWVLCVGHRDW